MEQQRRNAAGPRFLTFEVEDEVFAIPILKVKEIVGFREVTPLPQTAPSVVGVINLRGTIIPVVDLRIRFGLGTQAPTKQTSIIVLDLRLHDEPLLMGVVVDRVHEVQVIPVERISRLSGLETRVKARYVDGVAETAVGLRILIDVDKILSEDELADLEGTPQPRKGGHDGPK